MHKTVGKGTVSKADYFFDSPSSFRELEIGHKTLAPIAPRTAAFARYNNRGSHSASPRPASGLVSALFAENPIIDPRKYGMLRFVRRKPFGTHRIRA